MTQLVSGRFLFYSFYGNPALPIISKTGAR